MRAGANQSCWPLVVWLHLPCCVTCWLNAICDLRFANGNKLNCCSLAQLGHQFNAILIQLLYYTGANFIIILIPSLNPIQQFCSTSNARPPELQLQWKKLLLLLPPMATTITTTTAAAEEEEEEDEQLAASDAMQLGLGSKCKMNRF